MLLVYRRCQGCILMRIASLLSPQAPYESEANLRKVRYQKEKKILEGTEDKEFRKKHKKACVPIALTLAEALKAAMLMQLAPVGPGAEAEGQRARARDAGGGRR